MTNRNGTCIYFRSRSIRNLTSSCRSGEGFQILNEREKKVQEKWDDMSTAQKIGDWASRREYSLIMGSWALSLGVAGAIISRDK